MLKMDRDGTAAGQGSLTRRATFFLVGSGFSLLLGLVLRLYHLTLQPLWVDELYTAELVQGGLGAIWRTSFLDVLPPLSGLPFWLFGQIGTVSATSLRLVSVAAGVVSLWVFWRYCFTVLDRRAALPVLALFAVSPLAVYYSQEARPYSLALMGAVMTSCGLERIFRRGDRASWVLYALSAAAAAQFHYFNAVVVGAQLATLLIVLHDRRALLGVTSVFLFVALTLGPFLIGPLLVVRGWSPTGGLAVLPAMQTLLAGDSRFAPPLARTIALVVMAGGMALAYVTRRPDRLLLQHSLQIVLPGLVAFVLLPLSGKPGPAYDERVFLMILPSVLVVFGIALQMLVAHGTYARLTAAILVMTLCLTSTISLVHYFGDFVKSPEGKLAEMIVAHAQAGDIVISNSDAYSADAALKFYGRGLRIYRYQGEAGSRYLMTPNPSVLVSSPMSLPTTELEGLLNADRLWLIERAAPVPYWDRLAARFSISSCFSAQPFTATLLVRR